MTLQEVKLNTEAIIKELKVQGSIRRRLLDLGILPNTVIEPVHTSPSGYMRAYFIKGALIALRDSESSEIIVEQRG